MKNLILLTMALMVSSLTLAQQNRRYIVKHGTRIKDTFKFNDIYLFPSFTSGKVLFKTGDTGGGSMNYNRLTGEMDFIQSKDTLALADREKIKTIVLGGTLFYVQTPDGYLQRLDAIDKVILAKKEIIESAGKIKPNNSETFTQTLAPEGTYNSFVSGLPVGMVAKVDLVFDLRVEYYLGSEKGNFKVASKKTLPKFFPEKKELVTKYLEEHPVDFTNLESLQNAFKDIREMK
jgi:hypothetical protein